MRQISKGREPASLTRHRAAAHASYNNLGGKGKSELRAALVCEQRGLCCYCMGRIRTDAASMKIEHWRCQTGYPAEQLTYVNLLAGCLGGEHGPTHLRCCDTSKGDTALKWNPADPAHRIEERVQYELDGTIRSSDPDFDAQLNTVLNLNIPVHKNARRAALDGVLDWWRREQGRLRGSTPPETLKRKLQHISNGPELQPYSPVAAAFIRRKLARTAATR